MPKNMKFQYMLCLLGKQVGLYDSKFKFNIGDHRSSGTRAKPEMYLERRANERHTNKILYQMFPGIHHKKGTEMAAAAMEQLSPPSYYKPWTNMLADKLVDGRMSAEDMGTPASMTVGGVERPHSHGRGFDVVMSSTRRTMERPSVVRTDPVMSTQDSSYKQPWPDVAQRAVRSSVDHLDSHHPIVRAAQTSVSADHRTRFVAKELPSAPKVEKTVPMLPLSAESKLIKASANRGLSVQSQIENAKDRLSARVAFLQRPPFGDGGRYRTNLAGRV